MKVFAALETFTDDRGVIKCLLPDDQHIHSVLYITGKAGAVRANHWHMKDTHYCYVLSGSIEYSYLTPGSSDVRSVTLVPGDVVFTPKKEVHKFTFLTDGVFVAMATEPRSSQESYESDTVRQNI